MPIPPRSESEELIANIWRDVLRIEDVSVNDNFFALGGHSLSAIQIVSRLQESVNIEVPLRILFDNPTVAALRETIETIIRDGQAPELPPIVRVPRDRTTAIVNEPRALVASRPDVARYAFFQHALMSIN